MKIIAVDPGCAESAYVVLDDDLRPVNHGIVLNEELPDIIYETGRYNYRENLHFAIEMVESYGMAVGKEVFETVFWIGRFWEIAFKCCGERTRIYRKDVKTNLCHNTSAKDANIAQALIDRFAYNVPNRGKGTKKAPGWFYGFKDDVWQAYAVGVTYHDIYLAKEKEA